MTGPDPVDSPTSVSGPVSSTPRARRTPTAESIARHRTARALSGLLNQELPGLVGVSWRARDGRFEVIAVADLPGPLLRDAAARCAVALGLDPEADLLALGDHEILGGPMALAITTDRISGEKSPHWAVPCDPADPYGKWVVSWLPGQPLGRNQAITAMTIAETVATVHAEGSRRPLGFSHRSLSHVASWSGELGLTAAHAIVRVTEHPADPMVADAAESRGAP